MQKAFAAASIEDMLLYYRGIMLHPARPEPEMKTQATEITWYSHTQQDALTGQIFTDSACKPHVIPELTRAAPGVVLMDEQ